MATQDGFSPYPINLTAAQSVAAIHRAHNLEETLAHYPFIAQTETPPTLETVKTSGEFWYCTKTAKLYRCYINETEGVILWFEV